MKATSVTLGKHFDDFIRTKISEGRYSDASEVICASLHLLEEEENRIMALKDAIEEGLGSGIAIGFNPEQHLQLLKTKHANG